MVKDPRYKVVKTLIGAGDVTRFAQILDIVPKTVMAQDLGMHHHTFDKLLKDPERFTYKLTFWIASLIDVEEKALVDLIFTECMENKKTKKKK